MLPFNDSITPNSSPSALGNQKAYRELIHHLGQFFSEETLTERLNVEQMFILVDGVLPIEACLYYQVLPLFLDGSRLHLGMVNPEDTTASDYVRRIVSYLNYSLLTRKISSQALQAALSAYLKYSDSQSSAQRPATTDSRQASIADPILQSSHEPVSQPVAHNLDTNNKETLVLDMPETLSPSEALGQSQDAIAGADDANAPVLPADDLTCIDPEQTDIISFDTNFDTDDDLQTQLLSAEDLLDEGYRGPEFQPVKDIQSPQVQSAPPAGHGAAFQTPKRDPAVAPDASNPFQAEDLTEPPAVNHVAPPSRALNIESNGVSHGENPTANAAPLSIQVQSDHLDKSIDDLAELSPRNLLRELLVRAMSDGIGRLYFERKPDYGRILWSQSGILQAAVNNIEPVKFQALINEFKRLTRLPLLPLRNTKQVELERFYKGNRVLLRFRFIPGKHGEQITLQVLRGAALTFYQQQQVTRIGQDAVGTAKRLQGKIGELQSRLEAYPKQSTSQQASLPELKQMLLNLENQVDALNQVVLPDADTNSSSPG